MGVVCSKWKKNIPTQHATISAHMKGGSHVDGSLEERCSYQIAIFTGSRCGAGSDVIWVTLVVEGTNGASFSINLNNCFCPGEVDQYNVTTKDIGEPLLIKLKIFLGDILQGTWFDWFVDRVTVKDISTNITYIFPCYCWIQDETLIFEGSAKLPVGEQSATLKKYRAEELKNRQSLYQWGRNMAYSDMPGYIKAAREDSLPKDVRFTNDDTKDLFIGGITSFVNLGLMSLWNGKDWESFDDMHQTFKNLMGDLPPAAKYWRDDRFFGSQFLDGCNPNSLFKCTRLPPHFPIKQELIGNLLDSGDTLESALMNGRIYMVDYKILEGIPCYEGRYVCASMGLFYVKDNGDLVPIAIQLHQTPSAENPIWTPNDAEMDWICAKLWLRNSDGQFHQMIAHLLRTHLSMEAIAVAGYRQLPTIHPLWKLLAPHIRGTFAINTLARCTLINEGGLVDQLLSIGGGGHMDLIKKYFKTMRWPSFDLPQVLKERGVDDGAKLPNFYYREDGLKLWAAIGEFVQRILGIYYPSDDTIMLDSELQNWIIDLHVNGYRDNPGDTDHGVPTSFTSRQQLYDFVTAIIFTCSCQHAAVNFPQVNVYGIPPNAPLLMREPPPTQKGVVTEQHLMTCLPSKHQSALSMTLMYELTRYFPDEPGIGDYPEKRFVEEAPLAAISDFQQKLKEISTGIKERNFRIPLKYPYLNPEQVPNSVAI